MSGVQEMRVLQRLLAELPPKCQYAFVMNRFHSVDVVAIAEEMQLTETMVRRYITRALIHCRAGLDAATGTGHDKE